MPTSVPSPRIRRAAPLLALLVVLAAAVVLRRAWPAHPNLLLVTVDTTRADRLGCYGYADAATPTLDRLAREGVRFASAYANVPLTLPSHTTILTGMLPPEHGIRLNSIGALSTNIPTLATLLSGRGYDCGAFTAASVLAAKYGLRRGFGEYSEFAPTGAVDPLDEQAHPSRPASAMVDVALSWLKKPRRAPFFCWLHLYDPHHPYENHRDRFGETYRDRPYDAEIAYMDAELGRLFDWLRGAPAVRNTLILVVGDHGESLASDPWHEPRPHHGYLLHDPGLHVPLILAGAPLRAQGKVIPDLVSLDEVAPNLLELLGQPRAPGMRGRSWKPLLEGRDIGGRDLYAETQMPASFGWAAPSALITDSLKYIRGAGEEIYDREHDPRETNNLAGADSPALAELRARMDRTTALFTRHEATAVSLSEQDRRQLMSLGYVSGGGAVGELPESGLPDVKSMLPVLRMTEQADRLARDGRQADALPVWEQVLRRSPQTLSFRNSYALTLADCGKHDAAIAELRALLAALDRPADDNPYNHPGRDLPLYHFAANNLGFFLGKVGQYEEAEKWARTALELNPEQGAYHHTLGTIFKGKGDLRRALIAANVAVQFAPQNPEHTLFLAEVLLDQGETARARRIIEDTLGHKLPPNFRQQAETLYERAVTRGGG